MQSRWLYGKSGMQFFSMKSVEIHYRVLSERRICVDLSFLRFTRLGNLPAEVFDKRVVFDLYAKQ